MKTNILLATIMQLAAELYRQEIFLDPDSGEILRRQITEQGSVFYPIVKNEDTQKPVPYLYLNENNLFTISEVINSEKNGKKRTNIGLEAGVIRITDRNESGNNRNESGTEPEQKRDPNRKKSEIRAEKKRNALLRRFALEPFSTKYTGEMQAVCLQIEKLTAELLDNTNKKSTIDGIIELFNTGKKYAEAGDFYHLEQLKGKLQRKRNQQISAIQLNQKMQSKDLLSRKLKIYGSVALVGLAIIIGLISGLKHRNIGNNPINSTPTLQNFSPAEINRLIDDYCIRNNTKIFEWRRGKIIDAVTNPTTETRIFRIIDSVANYNYTKYSHHKHTKNKSTGNRAYYDPNTGIGYDPDLIKK